MNETQERVLRACNEVLSVLGGGHREKIYENALLIELQNDFPIVSQQHIPVMYKNRCVGQIVSDLVLDNSFVIEIKAQTTKISQKDRLQLMKYMKVANLQEGMIVNFCKEVSFEFF
jgi:GxxExxY protein